MTKTWFKLLKTTVSKFSHVTETEGKVTAQSNFACEVCRGNRHSLMVLNLLVWELVGRLLELHLKLESFLIIEISLCEFVHRGIYVGKCGDKSCSQFSPTPQNVLMAAGCYVFAIQCSVWGGDC